jgi:hypothetical protein
MPFDNPNADTVGGQSLQAIMEKGDGVPFFYASGDYVSVGPGVPVICQCSDCVRPFKWPPATGWAPGPALTPELRAVIVKARQLIAEGWMKGHDKVALAGNFGHPRYAYCMRGAIREAGGGKRTAMTQSAIDHVARFVPTMPALATSAEGMVVTFNDAVQTTDADVLEVFDRALA